MTDTLYDAVIVGAGVTGAIVARQLAESGKRVLILEAGSGAGLERGGFSSFVDRYYRSSLKTPTDPYPHSANAPVDAPFSRYYEQTGPQNFGSNYSRAAGGSTLHWMGTCLRFLPEDFRLKSLYGHGADWPISYEDLQPYYRMAEWELGVAATVTEQERVDKDDDIFAADYEFPMEHVPESYLDRLLMKCLEGKSVSVAGQKAAIHVSRTPAARNSTPRANLVDPRLDRKLDGFYRPLGAPDLPDERGQRCQGNSSCIPICPVQAKYSALKTLRQAINDSPGRVEVCTQAIASQIEVDPASGRVSGIRYKQYYDPDSNEFSERVAHGRLYVIAAHAIETAKLLLASHAANSSDMVGRNLMDHPFVLTWGLMPHIAGAYRGPGSTSGIPLMRDGDFRRDFAACRIEIGNWGVDFPNGTPESTIRSLVDRARFNEEHRNGHPERIRQKQHRRDLFGKKLRSVIGELGSRQFRFGFELEQLPEPANRVTIDPRRRDAVGNYRPVISYRLDDYCRRGIVEAKKLSDQFFQLLGPDAVDETSYDPGNPIAAGDFELGGQRYEYHGAGHLCGTHRMGSSRRDSVVDADQRAWDHENLFLVGCGNFCTVGTANPTLTAAALAFKASRSILKDLT
jgi:choline dehydrogenase-like flavoprotein